MKKVGFVFLLTLLAVFASPVSSAHAELYETPSMKNIVKSLIRFSAINIYEDAIIDVYARTNECEIYRRYFSDEFKWEQIRGKLREMVREEVITYPTGYKYDTTLKLDRYNFQTKTFPFTQTEDNTDVNVFTMVTHQDDFCVQTPTGFPTNYRLVFDRPIRIPNLPLSEDEGGELIKRMNANNNPAHLVFLRFNVRVTYVASLNPEIKDNRALQEEKAVRVQQKVELDRITLDSRLDSIEFFEDEARTKLIYRYRP